MFTWINTHITWGRIAYSTTIVLAIITFWTQGWQTLTIALIATTWTFLPLLLGEAMDKMHKHITELEADNLTITKKLLETEQALDCETYVNKEQTKREDMWLNSIYQYHNQNAKLLQKVTELETTVEFLKTPDQDMPTNYN